MSEQILPERMLALKKSGSGRRQPSDVVARLVERLTAEVEQAGQSAAGHQVFRQFLDGSWRF